MSEYSPPAIEELPLRGQIGYVINYATVREGDLTPAVVVGMLAAKGLVENVEATHAIAEEVFAQRGLLDA